MSDHTPGAGFGRALSRVLGDTMIHAAGATSDHQQQARVRATYAMAEHAETHLAPVLRELLAGLLERDDLPDQWRTVLTRMVEPGAQFDFLLQIIGLAGAVFTALFTLGPIEVQALKNELFSDYANVPLSPADLADMVERNIAGHGWAEIEAKKSGISPELFDLLVKNTGEPYGIEQALSLLRRGLITEERFTEILYYSRVRNEFLPDVLQLAHATMTPGDAIELALKEITDTATARDYFAKGGGLVDQFDELVAAAGNPIGPEAAVRLWAHGAIDETQLRQVIAHSRINPMFYELAKLTNKKWPSIIQVRLILEAGAISAADATRVLVEDGYDPDFVAKFVAGAGGTKVAKHKELTEAQITSLYESGFLDHGAAAAQLAAIGYDPSVVDDVLAVYEQKRKVSITQAGITRVGKAFMVGRITEHEASGMLDRLGVDSAARDDHLALWAVEAATELRELTAAQVGGFAKKGLITYDEAVSRWVTMGYDEADAALLSASYGGPLPAGSPAALQAGQPPPP